MIKKNKFLAKPNIFYHERMPGTETHPGFHTSDIFDIACMYALARCSNSLDEVNEFHYVYDYPVVAVIDMRGLKKHLDYDTDVTARYIFEDSIECIVNEYPGIENFSDDEIFNIINREVYSLNEGFSGSSLPDNSVDAYMYSVFDPSCFTVARLVDYDWAPKIIRKYAETKTIPDWVLMCITGQYRYIEDVDENRVIGVYYITPLSTHVFFEEEEEKEIKEKRKWPGFDCPYIYDILERYYSPGITLVYGEDVLNEKQIDIFGHEPILEYHGTVLSLFRKAAPEISKMLPEPPCPPYRPENMTREKYLEKVKTWMKDNNT